MARLRESGHEVVDFAARSLSAGDDYPDFVVPLAGWSLPGMGTAASRSAAAAKAPPSVRIRFGRPGRADSRPLLRPAGS
jgi:hypothetical protein